MLVCLLMKIAVRYFPYTDIADTVVVEKGINLFFASMDMQMLIGRARENIFCVEAYAEKYRLLY